MPIHGVSLPLEADKWLKKGSSWQLLVHKDKRGVFEHHDFLFFLTKISSFLKKLPI